MENKELILNYEKEEDCGFTTLESIYSENESIYFEVCNLNECPEDAIIDRQLFNAEDYIKALKLGMELAKKGYTSIKVVEVKEEEE